MLQGRMDLVFEFFAVDAAAATACAGGVAGLDHEGGNDAVDEDVGVVAALGEGGEVFACLVIDGLDDEEERDV